MVTGETCQVLSFSFYKKFKWNLVLFTSYSNLRKFPVLTPDYHTIRPKSPCSDKFNFQCLWPIKIRGSHITRACWHFKHSYDTVYITVMCLFCNQIWRCIYRYGEALYGECSYIEEAVYMNIIHGNTVQWESRNQSCSVIMDTTHSYYCSVSVVTIWQDWSFPITCTSIVD